MAAANNLLPEKQNILVLSLLAEGDKYGYEIIKELEQRFDDTFHLKEGYLYPLLHNLVQSNYAKSYVKKLSLGYTRRCYRITRSGKNYLAKQTKDTKKIAQISETKEQSSGGNP